MAHESPVRFSRNRKSRSRGLRTTTGCATCRKRHIKCDENKPICGPCAKVNKPCVYTRSSVRISGFTEEVPETTVCHSSNSPVQGQQTPSVSVSSPGPETAAVSNELPETGILPWGNNDNGEDADTIHRNPLEQLAAVVAASQTTPLTLQETSEVSHPISTGSPTVSAAAVQWFGLLANDAARESPQISTTLAEDVDLENITPLQRATRIVDHNHLDGDDCGQSNVSTGGVNSAPESALFEEHLWQAQEHIQLLSHEYFLFENFVQRISQWIDLFDPTSKFATFVPHLAMRNAGLLNAILALSCRHLSLNSGVTSDKQPRREMSLQYYYQTLHYVQKAMQYSSYKTSLELLATTLTISTYEMLDDSCKDWERHLEGVFLIQRSQVIHGESEGLKSAVWWAWLCQDVWAAFREKRKTLTFWTPKKPHSSLSPFELAARSVYIIAKVINYCSREESVITEANTVQARVDRAGQLRDMLDEWRRHLTIEFSPLPVMSKDKSAVFRPIWIRIPAFAVAMQLHCAARILLCTHKPCLGGIDQYLEQQATVKQCVDIICGIAVTLKDDASSLMSSQCVFIAGIFAQDDHVRKSILGFLYSCRQRTGWPVNPLGDELQELWTAYETPQTGGHMSSLLYLYH